MIAAPDLTEVKLTREAAVARLTFARPTSLNALSPDLISQALAATESVAASDARVLVLAGEGRSFSAGVDLKSTAQNPDFRGEAVRRFSDEARRLAVLFETMPQVVIARVAGHCFTGGLELALACDLIVAAEDAVFCDTHAKLGMRPGWGLSQRLPRRIGQMRAREMSFTARRVGAAEALALGLVLEVAPLVELDARIEALATAIIANDAAAIAAYKTLYRACETHTLDDGLAFEATTRFPRKIPSQT